MSGPANLPPQLESKLTDFRRRVWTIKLAEGLLASIFGLALSYLLVLALDRLIETPQWTRVALLVLGAAVPGLGLPLKWHRWVWRQRRLEDAAKLLRWRFPRLGDQLLGIVELAKDDHGAVGRSERLVAAAMEQADAAVQDQDLSKAVPEARHWHWTWAALAVVAVTVTLVAPLESSALTVKMASSLSDTTLAFVMTTSVLGLSRKPVSTAEIASSTSNPSTSCPKMV